MVSITLQLLLLVYWISVNKTEWISQHDDDDDDDDIVLFFFYIVSTDNYCKSYCL